MFIDEAEIEVIAGKGGNGIISFRREKYVPRGGPDGGDGGDGGSVFLSVDAALNTLNNFRYRRHFEATSGAAGEGRQKTGKRGDDLIIDVPAGTAVYDADTNECLGDLTRDEHLLKVAQGGEHGLGNVHFKSSKNQAPRIATPGTIGESRRLRLELRVMADVGLLGLPNAGKSSLLRCASNARPKVADYPFTTLEPHLGVISVHPGSAFVMADIPGVIAGAAQGIGLGLQFLRHIQRTKLLLHLVDSLPTAGSIQDNIAAIEKELLEYDEALSKKPRWLIMNKIDLLDQEQRDTLRGELTQYDKLYFISTVNKEGISELLNDLHQFIMPLD